MTGCTKVRGDTVSAAEQEMGWAVEPWGFKLTRKRNDESDFHMSLNVQILIPQPGNHNGIVTVIGSDEDGNPHSVTVSVPIDTSAALSVGQADALVRIAARALLKKVEDLL